jgi:hypothetical protein
VPAIEKGCHHQIWRSDPFISQRDPSNLGDQDPASPSQCSYRSLV